MTRFARISARAAGVAVVAAMGLAAYIRLAPSEPRQWHQSPVTATDGASGPCKDAVLAVEGGARAACRLPGTPESVLTRLDQTAMTAPRTTRLAGTPKTGRITWITRSALMGYPDYTTAEATQTPTGTRLDVYARQRFGASDFGVNAARLTGWLSDL